MRRGNSSPSSVFAAASLTLVTVLFRTSVCLSQSAPPTSPQFQYALTASFPDAFPNSRVALADGAAAPQQAMPPIQLTSVCVGQPSTDPNHNLSAPNGQASPDKSPDAANGVTVEQGELKAGPILGPNGPMRTLPFYVSDGTISARAAAVYDTTRMNPAAGGHFYTSAIPVKGDAFFGSGGRSTMQGSGSGVGMDFGLRDTDFSGHVFVEATSLTSDPNQQQFGLTQAYGKWKDVTFGVSESTFTDQNTMPDTFELAGPAGRPAILNGQPRFGIRISTPIPNLENSSGVIGNISIEVPQADVNLPSVTDYATFSRYPDFVTTIRYQAATVVCDPCDSETRYGFEYWHVQFGAVVRDLGVEGNGVGVNPVRQTTTGWGTQLSGQFKIFPNPTFEAPNDSVLFSLTWGQGIGHYFPDLNNVSPVNDAAYNTATNTLTPLPLFAYFVGYEHDWTARLRSTVVYSRIDLDSISIPGATTPYRRGDYMAINLVLHQYQCLPNDTKRSSKSAHCFMGGLEYLFGQRENLAGDWGADQRILLFIAASN